MKFQILDLQRCGEMRGTFFHIHQWNISKIMSLGKIKNKLESRVRHEGSSQSPSRLIQVGQQVGQQIAFPKLSRQFWYRQAWNHCPHHDCSLPHPVFTNVHRLFVQTFKVGAISSENLWNTASHGYLLVLYVYGGGGHTDLEFSIRDEDRCKETRRYALKVTTVHREHTTCAQVHKPHSNVVLDLRLGY